MKLDAVVIESLNVIRTKTSNETFNVTPRNHHSLSYRIEGENIVYSENAKITSNAGSLTFVPAGTGYTHNVVTPSEQIVVHFTTKHSICKDIECFTLPLNSNAELLFYDLYQKWELTQKENNLPCMAAFYNILALIMQNEDLMDNPKEKKMLDPSVAYMHAHYRESDFSIERLYQAACISPAYYRRIFAKVYKCSPVKYLKNLRINYAKQLLHNGYHRVAEIAELSGFSDRTYFSYEFKKMTGYSPSQYISNKVIRD